MNKEFIPYEQALKLKELGFDEPCIAYYNFGERLMPIDTDFTNFRELSDGLTKAPLYQQAFRWFRENCEVYSEILSNVCGTEETYFTFNIMTANVPFQLMSENNTFFSSDIFNTYEEAELACLKELIEIVKNK